MHPTERCEQPTSCWAEPPFPGDLGSSNSQAVHFQTVQWERRNHLGGCWQAGGWTLQSEKSVCVWKSPRMQNQTWLLLKTSWLKWACCSALRGPRLHSCTPRTPGTAREEGGNADLRAYKIHKVERDSPKSCLIQWCMLIKHLLQDFQCISIFQFHVN